MSTIEEIQSMEQIKRDIIRARQWARKHFNVEQEEDHVLAPPTFDIEYPEPDKIQVWSRCYGKRLWPSFTYTLIWVGETLIWRTYYLIHGTQIDLVVKG